MDVGAFENVTIQKRINSYYNGGITSRELTTETGERKTLGVMHPGEYELETTADERRIVEIYSGELSVILDKNQTVYTAGETYTVDPDTNFTLNVSELVNYCCTYHTV